MTRIPERNSKRRKGEKRGRKKKREEKKLKVKITHWLNIVTAAVSLRKMADIFSTTGGWGTWSEKPALK